MEDSVGLKSVFCRIDELNMDNVNDVRVLVRKFKKYLRTKEDYSDIEILQSKVFRQIFVAHNFLNVFRVYNSWSFMREVKEYLLRDFSDVRVVEQEEFVDLLLSIF